MPTIQEKLTKQIEGRGSRSYAASHSLKKKHIMVSTTSMSNLNARSNSLLILKANIKTTARANAHTSIGDYGQDPVAAAPIKTKTEVIRTERPCTPRTPPPQIRAGT